jgi:hypothetical protein
VIPKGAASIAPESFGAADEVEATLLTAVYKGTFKPAKTGRFRLIGRADDLLIVRINGRMVIDASLRVFDPYSNWEKKDKTDVTEWKAPNRLFNFGRRGDPVTGDWFQLSEGVDTEIEVLLGEVPGGEFGGYLLIEKRGSSKPEIFSTKPLSSADKKFLRDLHPDCELFL